ncbi:hypothetical protein HU200_023606 [Digitaria exilis]|uniref:Probable quinone oxidoreductase n=1 Tax=Digitaria exilis TaxID=1010633 RepID=A0A835EWL9_9POAL|nr:hypothetical protein HU200_023606 [Digitaria exilis]
MVKAFRVHEHGGPEVLRWEEVEIEEPGQGEIRMRNTAIGVNFLDVYMRKGVYPTPLPFTPGTRTSTAKTITVRNQFDQTAHLTRVVLCCSAGVESVGVVTAVGPEVTGIVVGDVVGLAGSPMVTGRTYAEEQIIPAAVAIPIPDWMDHKVAASVLVKGITARILVRQAFKVEAGQTVLVHAAAGGVGSLVCQWASALGATVIGAVSSRAKAEQAAANGCHHVVVYTEEEEDFVARVRDGITAGCGVDVVYDAVGKDTSRGSIACLANRGCLVAFGEASGAPEPFVLGELQPRSLSVTCPALPGYTGTREALLESAAEVFAGLASGVLRAHVGGVYPLAEAPRAHADLEGRRTSGSIVLVPGE